MDSNHDFKSTLVKKNDEWIHGCRKIIGDSFNKIEVINRKWEKKKYFQVKKKAWRN